MAGQTIPTSQARALYTQQFMGLFRDARSPKSFLRSLFTDKTSFTEYVSIQVKRNYENVASDVQRGTRGNINYNSKSTEKIFRPPFFDERFNMTEIDLYDRLVGSADISAGEYSQLMNNMLDQANILRSKIERAYEKQCAEVLELGTVTTTFNDTVNYRRKNASMTDAGSGNYWTTSTVDVFADIAAMCKFIRQYGKSTSSYFNLIMGDDAAAALFANGVFKERVTQNLNNNIDKIYEPTMAATGAVPHGVLSCGPYKVALWSYPEYYDVSGVSTPYINTKKVVCLPTDTDFNMMFAAVPQVLVGWNATPGVPQSAQTQSGAFVIDNYPDIENTAHWCRIKSAGLAVPVSVDRISTRQVVAS